MKITKRQLRQIIREQVEQHEEVDEGIIDSIKSGWTALTTGTLGSTLEEAGSKEALELFKAMAGTGTNDSVVKKIFVNKNSKQIVQLYNDFHSLMTKMNEPSISKTFAQGALGSVLNAASYNGDLIEWLESDGLKIEAALVKLSLRNYNIPRKDFDFTLI